jgi:hypothetical protein
MELVSNNEELTLHATAQLEISPFLDSRITQLDISSFLESRIKQFDISSFLESRINILRR